MGGALIGRVNHYGALAGLIVGGLVAIGLLVASGMGWLADIAQETLSFRAMTTFGVTFVVMVVVSLLTGHSEMDTRQEQVDISNRISPAAIRLTLLLAAGIVGMILFWSYYF